MTFYGGADLARNFRIVRKNTLQIAEEIPESRYGFQAAPGTRSAAQLLAHIAGAVRWAHRVHAVERIAKRSARCTIKQLMLLERMVGIVPHLTRQPEERAAARR
jgi:hypothetical protein